ncbi:hypothetical protein ACFQ4K_03375 [Tistrella bauzanensis]
MTETLETALTAGDAGAPRTAAILVIGNEILSGRTQDVNVRMIATKLAPAGIRWSRCGWCPISRTRSSGPFMR